MTPSLADRIEARLRAVAWLHEDWCAGPGDGRVCQGCVGLGGPDYPAMARAVAEEVASTTAWLIESDGPPTHYLGTVTWHGKINEDTLVGWTTDVNAAIRFCRKEDATRAATLVLRGYKPKAVEHLWCAALAATEEKG